MSNEIVNTDDDIDDDNSSILSSISTFSNLSLINQLYIQEFDNNEKKLKENNGKFITDYQYKIANDIYNIFNKNKECVLGLAIAETQMGKTGIMQAITKEFIINNLVESSNIFIITGLSSTEWKNQTQNRFVGNIKDNIFHSNTLPKFEKKLLENDRNILIIIDEIHIASKLNNRLGNIFKSVGLLNITNLIERNIKIVQVSATPDLILTELYDWQENNYQLFIIKSPDNYIGIKKLLDNNQIREYKSLTDINNVIEIKNLILKNYKEPKYHLIRINTDIQKIKIEENIKKVFDKDKYNIKYYCIDNNGDKLYKDYDLNNNFLNHKPNKHYIIILKEKARCSYTINKNYIGILYDRKAKDQEETTIIQGFAGRACGYYDNSNKDIIVFTNISIINEYIIKIDEAHKKELYKTNKKIKKTINNVDTIYNNKLISDNDNNNGNNINNKKFNIITIYLEETELQLLITNVNDKEVFIDKEFDKILIKNKLYDFFKNYKDCNFKLTFKPKPHNKILDAINNKTYINYTDLYASTSSQIKLINKHKKGITTIINKSRNELYLIHFLI